jgi:hypothetical protein
MNSPNTRRGREPARRAARLAPRAGEGKRAMQISYSITRDGPDGQPWPPPDGTALWAIVRRADDCTLWRTIQLAQVRTAATDFCNFADRQQAQLKRQL